MVLITRSRSCPISSSSAAPVIVISNQSVTHTRKQSVMMYRNGDPIRPNLLVPEKEIAPPLTSNERCNRFYSSILVFATQGSLKCAAVVYSWFVAIASDGDDRGSCEQIFVSASRSR